MDTLNEETSRILKLNKKSNFRNAREFLSDYHNLGFSSETLFGIFWRKLSEIYPEWNLKEDTDYGDFLKLIANEYEKLKKI